MDKVIGKVTNLKRLKSSAMGNPRYEFTLNGEAYKTSPNATLGYSITNHEDKIVTLQWRRYRGHKQAVRVVTERA